MDHFSSSYIYKVLIKTTVLFLKHYWNTLYQCPLSTLFISIRFSAAFFKGLDSWIPSPSHSHVLVRREHP